MRTRNPSPSLLVIHTLELNTPHTYSLLVFAYPSILTAIQLFLSAPSRLLMTWQQQKHRPEADDVEIRTLRVVTLISVGITVAAILLGLFGSVILFAKTLTFQVSIKKHNFS